VTAVDKQVLRRANVRLAGKVEALEGKVVDLERQIRNLKTERDAFEGAVSALDAERGRYRAALKWIAERYEWDATGCPARAREALALEGTQEP
jgi:uncharacterized protein YhaN